MLITEHGEDDYGLPMDAMDFKDCREPSLTTGGDVAFSLDADCDINQDDFLQQLPIDLEIPLLMGQENGASSLLEESDCLEQSMAVDSHNFDGLVDLDDLDLHKWVPHTFPSATALPDGIVCSIKDEIKTEPPPSPPSSVSSLSSLSEGVNSPEGLEGTVDIKVILETPPISPPREGDIPTLGAPCTLVSTNVGTILPTTIISTPQPCIVPQPHIPKISKGVKVIRPKLSSSQMQPRKTLPDTEVSGSKSSQQAIILTAKEFVALANQIKKGKTNASRGSVALVTGVPSTPIAEKTLVSVSPSAPTIACQLGNSKADLEQAKAMKRQQRMIKNRESACLSRKKKKEYVATLEEQLAQLRKENDQLKMENFVLRNRLGEFGVDVQSDDKSVWMGSSPPHSPKSPFSSLLSSPPIFSANTKKVTAFFAILLVISLNIGPFGGLLQNDQLSSQIRRSASSGPVSVVERGVPRSPGAAAVMPGVYSSGRTLLWSLGKSDLPSLDSEEEDDDVSGSEFDVVNASMPHPTCPLPINVTESIRLDSELRGWFGKESWMAANLSASEKGSPMFKGPHSWLVPPHPTPLPLRENPQAVPKHAAPRRPLPSFETLAQNRMKKKGSKLRQWPLGNPSLIQGREVAVYGPRGGEGGRRRNKYEFSALLEAIGRREDRFYVVSFSGDHLLLPASAPALNASHQPPRPKMTLLLPAVMPNGTVDAPLDHITMMQIDCEVTDTQLMTVRQGVIPSHLRSRSSSGTSTQSPTAPCNNGTASQGLRKAGAAAFNPYLRQEGRGRL